MSGHGGGARFRTDVEGLRAVAVLAVLAFHADVPGAGGGYVGVDAFFVISGFVITASLLGQLRSAGTVSLPAFYAARARRILPAAGVVLLAVVVLGAWLVPPLGVADTVPDVVAAALFASNWWFVRTGTSYAAEGLDPSPVLHFWSLAVEEQFYLVWPAVVLAAAVLARRRRWSVERAVLVAAGVLVVGSFTLGVLATRDDAAAAYFATPGRAWQLGGGALVAVAAPRVPAWGARVAPVLAVGGVLALGASITVYTADTPFPGTAALLPVLGVAAVVASGGWSTTTVHRALSWAPVRAVGRLSFSWYLWHWPAVVLAEELLDAPGWPVLVAVTAASALPAWLTLVLVEQPLRTSRPLRARAWRSGAVGLAAVALPLCGALVAGQLADGALREQVAAAGENPHLGRDLRAVPATATAGPVFPAPVDVRANQSGMPDRCVATLAVSALPVDCVFGDVDAPQRLVLFGDSHAQQWFPAVDAVARSLGLRMEPFVKSTCPPETRPFFYAPLGRDFTECDDFRANVVADLAADPPAVVLVAGLNRPFDQQVVRAAWTATFDALTATGAQVVYLADTPRARVDVARCLSGNLDDWTRCSTPRSVALPPDVAVDAAREHEPRVGVLDLNDVLCPGEVCPTVRGGQVLYYDRSHVSGTAASALGPAMRERLQTLLE